MQEFKSKSRQTQETIERILEMKREGVTSRVIAEEVLGRASAKSTINDLWREYKEFEADLEEYQPLTMQDDHRDQVPVQSWEVPMEQLDSLAESSDMDVAALAKRLRTAQKANAQLRKIHRQSLDGTEHFEAMQKAVEMATSRIRYSQPKTYVPARLGAQKATMEVLFSDFQIGKIGQHYDSDLAHKGIKRYGEKILQLVEERKMTYDLERIVFASLGDIVEDHMKHGIQSATSCDSGLAEQMANAIEYIWTYLVQPLAVMGIPMDLYGIAGNHGSSQHKGMDMFKAGLYSYDYTIYRALEGYCKVAGYDNVRFHLPEGVFGCVNIYGSNFVYEHGYFNASTEKSISDQMKKRGQQLRMHVDGIRIGDMHHVCSFDNHKMVLNGAFFGLDTEGLEFSGILGFNSVPAQVVMFHTPEYIDGRNTIKEFISVQLAMPQ